MYTLGVDVGTAQTTTCSIDVGDRPEEGTGSAPDLRRGVENVSAAAYVGPDGVVVTGQPAEILGMDHPENLIRGYVGRVGDAVDIVAGEHCVGADTVLAAAIRHAVGDATNRRGSPPVQVCVTHPAQWGPYRVGVLEAALATAGVPDVHLVADAVAAARSAAPDLADGQALAVLDVGAGSAAAAVVVRADGAFRLTGRSLVADDVGGAGFDDELLAHVCAGAGVGAFDRSVPGLGPAVRTLRAHCTAAKESLSEDTDAVVTVALPGCSTRIRVVRAELEDVIGPAVTECVELLGEVLATSGSSDADIRAVLLTGGSSRVPLVVQTVSTTIGLPIIVTDRPEFAAAEGAARLASDSVLAGAAPDDAGDQGADRRADGPAGVVADTDDIDSGTRTTDPHPEKVPDGDAAVDAPGDARAGRRATATASQREPGSGTRPRTARRKARKRALAATLLAAGLFAASAFAVPRLLQSDGAPDEGPSPVTATTTVLSPILADRAQSWSVAERVPPAEPAPVGRAVSVGVSRANSGPVSGISPGRVRAGR